MAAAPTSNSQANTNICSASDLCVSETDQLILTEDQIETFLQDGVLVVNDILSPAQLDDARKGLRRTLAFHGIDTGDLESTGHNLQRLSSTNGSGGVLDIFYPGWKMDVATNPRLFCVTCQLWEIAFCQETAQDLDENKSSSCHPYGDFDLDRGYMYVDRIGYRLPTDLAERIGSRVLQTKEASGAGAKTRKRKGKTAIQRSLTPHLDCCPGRFYSESASKFRPIQCFVSLTDNLDSNTGGFEAAPGFHRDFNSWSKSRPPTTIIKNVNGNRVETKFPAPCVGDYT